jgi:hypothetical protein
MYKDTRIPAHHRGYQRVPLSRRVKRSRLEALRGLVRDFQRRFERRFEAWRRAL